MTFELILAENGAMLSTAASPDDLDFSAAYPYMRWGVIIRYAAGYDKCAPYYTTCVARVNLTGAKDTRKAADRSVQVVRDWLIAGHATNDFDIVDYLADGQVIEINFKGAKNEH